MKNYEYSMLGVAVSAGWEPERMLALAVLERALADVGHEDDEVDREARQFCISRTGAAQRAREFWCSHAGIEVTAFARYAARLCCDADGHASENSIEALQAAQRKRQAARVAALCI